jgi:hypothetical protein
VLPPVKRRAWTNGEALYGERMSISRVPVQPPRISTPPVVSFGQRITVQPVTASASVVFPTRKPGTSVSIPALSIPDSDAGSTCSVVVGVCAEVDP